MSQFQGTNFRNASARNIVFVFNCANDTNTIFLLHPSKEEKNIRSKLKGTKLRNSVLKTKFLLQFSCYAVLGYIIHCVERSLSDILKPLTLSLFKKG